MDIIGKLKLGPLRNITCVNFPADVDHGIQTVKNDIQVVIYYIDKIEDMNAFFAYCDSLKLPKENRVVLVYRKNRKDGVGRDSIMAPFVSGAHPGYKQKAPMLCSLSDELSAFTFMKT